MSIIKIGKNILFFTVFIMVTSCVPNYYVQNTKGTASNIPEAVVKSRTYQNNHEVEKKEEFIPYKPIEVIEDTSIANKTLERNASLDVKNRATTSANIKADQILSTARTYLGTPYRYGGMSRSGIDCSAFVQKSFGPHDISLPRVSRDQAKKGHYVSKSQLEKGDLVFFATQGGGRVSHVGIIITPDGNNSSFIHASSSKGVTVSKLSNSYWSKRYLQARRIINSRG
ncbi:putative endopeptidase [Flavobacteriaceae bacterium UJ101]|nr:putative endopeptidase [Flavobacteriaceae bacterium UJ101]